MSHPYTKQYYDNYGHLLNSSYENDEGIRSLLHKVAEDLNKELIFRTHMDIGCAMGYLVEGMEKCGTISRGIDISEYAISKSFVPEKTMVWDISRQPLEEVFDIVTCIEVIEHIDPAKEDAAITNMCDASGKYLFFSSEYNTKEVTHINVKQRWEWVGIIERYGFAPRRFNFPYIPHAVLFERTRLIW